MTDSIEALEAKVTALQKELELRKKIAELEKELASLRWQLPASPWQPLFPPNPGLLGGCLHEFDNPWGASVPPACKKCGYRPQVSTITCGTAGTLS